MTLKIKDLRQALEGFADDLPISIQTRYGNEVGGNRIKTAEGEAFSDGKLAVFKIILD